MSKRVPMPRREPLEAIADFAETALGYSRDAAMSEALRAQSFDLEPARQACPFRVDVPAMVAHLADGDIAAARDTVAAAHPWPSILGRWCQRPCEKALAELGDAAPFISALERAAGDLAPPAHPHSATTTTAFRIAILGAGSAAIAAAVALRKRGHAVTMYDQLPAAGGMMLAGYPEFRLPRSVVAGEVDPAAWGIDFIAGTKVTLALTRQLLWAFDAVIAATGKFRAARLGIPGEDLAGVWDALDFLMRVKFGEAPHVGPTVLVIGGGHTARDASRVARRLGAQATIVYRRRVEDMPVPKSEIPRYLAQQRAEGVSYCFEAMPLRVHGAAGHVTAMEFCRTQSGGSKGGSPHAVPGSEFRLPCSSVIVATGETADVSFLPPELDMANGHVNIDPELFATNVPKLFAAGALAGTRTTTEAFKSGFDCAKAIDKLLTRDGRSSRVAEPR
jgi:NADPH-dependent glutamate synthase beta subunit-like oxidoreductase